MAVLRIAAPGTANGPCRDACAHTDCTLSRTMARSRCRICRHAIGFDQYLHRIAPDEYVHVRCPGLASEARP